MQKRRRRPCDTGPEHTVPSAHIFGLPGLLQTLVSVLFSVAIAVLLTSARSIWQLPVTYVLMYQAAWSALSIAVCALKQHN